MSTTLKYKGYDGSVVFSAENRVFHGSVLGIQDRVTFEGEGVADLETNFQSAIDEYLQICSDEGETARKTLQGNVQRANDDKPP